MKDLGCTPTIPVPPYNFIKCLGAGNSNLCECDTRSVSYPSWVAPNSILDQVQGDAASGCILLNIDKIDWLTLKVTWMRAINWEKLLAPVKTYSLAPWKNKTRPISITIESWGPPVMNEIYLLIYHVLLVLSMNVLKQKAGSPVFYTNFYTLSSGSLHFFSNNHHSNGLLKTVNQ